MIGLGIPIQPPQARLEVTEVSLEHDERHCGRQLGFWGFMKL